jgi:short-subunit dehydrogenase
MTYRPESALVTGASSGIGEAFAEALAARGTKLLLAARSDDRLQAVAKALRAGYGAQVETVSVDLSERDGARTLQRAAIERGFEPDLLINNAGYGTFGPFVERSIEEQLGMVHLNVEAVVALTHWYLPRMVARGGGAIVNIASAAAFQPLPYFATYAASKAFVLSFSEALWAEHRRSGVRILAVCPGPVADTRFGERARVDPSFFGDVRNVPREEVVASTLRALERGQPMVVPGFSNRALATITHFVPRSLQLLVTERIFRGFARGMHRAQ